MSVILAAFNETVFPPAEEDAAQRRPVVVAIQVRAPAFLQEVVVRGLQRDRPALDKMNYLLDGVVGSII
jgi:hypothetical protein